MLLHHTPSLKKSAGRDDHAEVRGSESLRRVGAVPGCTVLLFTLALVALAALPAAASARKHSKHRNHHFSRSASGCAGAGTPVTSASVQSMRSAVVCLVNQQRAARHLPRLHASGRLNRSAQGWTNSMVAHDFFSHGSNFPARISAVGFLWSSAGENIATGFVTPRQVVNAWMRSTGHCQNILNPTYRDVGTGVNPSGVRGYGSVGTWTQDFALPSGQGAPSGNWGPAHACPY